MTSRHWTRMTSAIVGAAWLAVVGAASLNADSKDTVADVMKAGREASAIFTRLSTDLTSRLSRATGSAKIEGEAQLAAIKKLDPIVGRLGRDQAFAKQALDLSNKKDKPGLSQLLGRDIGPKFEVRDIRDWYIYGVYEVNGYMWEYCVSSKPDCGGSNAFHRMIGKAKVV